MAAVVANGTHIGLGTEERLERLAKLERLGWTSALVAVTIDKLYEHEISEARTKLEGFEAELVEFETQYEIPSDDFFQQFEEGKLGDDMDFFDWSALVRMTRNLRTRLELLTQETATQEAAS